MNARGIQDQGAGCQVLRVYLGYVDSFNFVTEFKKIIKFDIKLLGFLKVFKRLFLCE